MSNIPEPVLRFLAEGKLHANRVESEHLAAELLAARRTIAAHERAREVVKAYHNICTDPRIRDGMFLAMTKYGAALAAQPPTGEKE
jgi:hypothetical protein